MDENDSTPRLDTGTDVDHEAAARVAAQLERADIKTEQSRAPAGATAQIMYRPAPVPAGSIAVEMPDAPFWFLVRLDLACETCRGSGRLPGAAEDDRNGHCQCVLDAVRACWNETAAGAEEHNAEVRAEEADSKLKKRVDAALARVNELEAECHAAVGDCEKEQAELTARIPELQVEIERCEANALVFRQRAADANADVNKRQTEAAMVRDEAIRRAHETFNEVLVDLTRSRQNIAVTLQEKLNLIDAEKSKLTTTSEAHVARLAYLKAGPEKIRRRFEEKLKGPRATLERLERQWKR